MSHKHETNYTTCVQVLRYSCKNGGLKIPSGDGNNDKTPWVTFLGHTVQLDVCRNNFWKWT